VIDPTWIATRQAALESQRSNFDTQWQEIAEYVVPHSANFNRKVTPGEQRMQRVFDSTPVMANVRFAAAMQSMMTPATQRWHQLEPVDPWLADNHEVRVYCDELVERLFAARYSPRAQFGQAIGEGFLAFGAFGNSVIEVSERMGEHLIYRAGHPREFYLIENEAGVVDALHRKFIFTARQAVERFGKDALPDEIKRAFEKAPETEFEFVHAVLPVAEARERGYDKPLPAFMRYGSCYLSMTGRKVVREAAYRTFPFAVGRYQTHVGEVYGRGPGDIALPDIKMLNEMMKTIIRAAHKAVDPPLLLPNDGVLQSFATRPNAMNYGAMASNGNALVQALKSGGEIGLGFELIEATRKAINDVFHVSLFTVLVDKPTGMTATEAMIRAQEKGALLAPIGQRAQGELLGGLIMRELDVLEAAGQLPPMPDVLAEAGGHAALRVQFAGPINQAQKAQDGVNLLNFIQTVGGMAEMFPGALDRVDEDEIVTLMADAQGVPDKALRDMKDVLAMRQQKQQQAAAGAAVQAAPLIAGAAKDLAQAQVAATAGPSPLPLPIAA
jgi:hypothetical protein